MKEINTEVLVAGSGLVGLVAAHCLSSLNYKVTLVDKKSLINSKTLLRIQEQLPCLRGQKFF